MKKKNLLKKISIFAFAVLAFAFTSCATNTKVATASQTVKSEKPSKVKKATLSKEDSRFFWRIDGTDKKGKPSTIYVQGTIHVGNQRLKPYSDLVTNAFKNADRVYGEISTDDYTRLENMTTQYVVDSYKEGRNLYDYLTDEEINILKELFTEEGMEQYLAFEPWVIESILTSAIYMASGLDSNLSVDLYFENENIAMGRKTQGLDTLKTQLDVMRFGDYDCQLYQLKESLGEYPFVETLESLYEMYEYYLADDRESLGEAFNDDYDDFSNEYEEKYYEEIIIKRNQNWAKTFKKLLDEGGSTFVFAGSAHFLGEDSVFEFLKKDGLLDF